MLYIMIMNIILIEPAEINNNQVTLQDRRADHIRNILKPAIGDKIRIGLINGNRGHGLITDINRPEVSLSLTLDQPSLPVPLTDLILALPRPIMLKRILTQATIMGINHIYLINASRVEKSFFNSSLLITDNYQKRLLNGLEQAGDTTLPQISIHSRFRPFIEDLVPELTHKWQTRLIAHPRSEKSMVTALPLKGRTVLAIGPEGGWVDFELGKFRELNFTSFSMGPRILKVDTAVTALLAQLELLRQLS